MTVIWHNLYLPSRKGEKSLDGETIAESLRDSLIEQGYILYDPFGLIPGAAYADSVKLFVAPASSGWVRVLISPENQLLPAIMESMSKDQLCLSLSFDESAMHVTVYKDGQEAELNALQPYLKVGFTVDDLTNAMQIQGEATNISGDTFPMGVLPDDLQSAAQTLNPKHIDRLFVKLMKKVNRQLSDTDENQAREVLNKRINWQSTGGQQVSQFVDCLTLPENWNKPEYVTLRDAFQRHRHRQRNPHGHLFPGDTEAMEAVPNALDFLPVYGGK